MAEAGRVLILIVALLAAAAIAVLPVLYLRDTRRERERRGVFFADAMAMFDRCRVTQDGMHFPVLEGAYRGAAVRLEPVLDDMGVRKVPSLWLKATLLIANPQRGVVDFMVRPQGIEVYSPSHDLKCRLDIPATWPQHAILCTDRIGNNPCLEVLAPHIAAFDDPKTKELLVTPRGVRFVYQAAQAERAEYLVLRQARFSTTRVDPKLIRTLLDRLVAIARDLDAAPEGSERKAA